MARRPKSDQPKGPELPFGVRLTVAYDGTDFYGWQAQPQGRTVQTTLEAAIDAIGQSRSRVRGCSRTDSGVHARGQVAAFACSRELPKRGWTVGLNGLLPNDVAVVDAVPCDPRYDPRYDAIKKLYRYRIALGPNRDPLSRRQAYYLSPQFARQDVDSRNRRALLQDYLAIDAMRVVAESWEGRHDFAALRAMSDDREQSHRTMHAIRVQGDPEGQSLTVEVEGDAFMKNMVRIMVGTLLEVGRLRMSVDHATGLLTSGRRHDAGPTAPAHGLTLERIWLGRKSRK